MTFRELFAGCWFSHGNHIRERRGKTYVLICEDCGSVTPFLAKQKLKVKRVSAKVLVLRKPATIQKAGAR